jgi:hypothetical protein
MLRTMAERQGTSLTGGMGKRKRKITGPDGVGLGGALLLAQDPWTNVMLYSLFAVIEVECLTLTVCIPTMTGPTHPYSSITT